MLWKALGSKTIIPFANRLAEILNLESTEKKSCGYTYFVLLDNKENLVMLCILWFKQYYSENNVYQIDKGSIMHVHAWAHVQRACLHSTHTHRVKNPWKQFFP